MMGARCPDCGDVVELPPGSRSGDLVECPNCAGHALRVREEGGRWVAALAHRVSCPACDELIAKTGLMAVPVITVDGEVIVGFDRGRLKRFLGI